MDVFRPFREPARSIYDALILEGARRRERGTDEWLSAEREAVLREAIVQARRLGIRAPTMADVEREERLAVGHSDYAAKWARGVAQSMLR
ncbi:hypothetical protein WK77_16255 [Burkholderia ubonensis]|nr:hypothetical protein WK77_16255 [Burkholderia ubonensis]